MKYYFPLERRGLYVDVRNEFDFTPSLLQIRWERGKVAESQGQATTPKKL
jgi:hypothetical protein